MAEIVNEWPRLPEATRADILATARLPANGRECVDVPVGRSVAEPKRLYSKEREDLFPLCLLRCPLSTYTRCIPRGYPVSMPSKR